MAMPNQQHLFSELSDLDAMQMLLADLHNDLAGRVARFHQLNDLCANLGSEGTMIPGGEGAYSAWLEARSSFVSGNYIATVMLCQGLAENILAAHVASSLEGPELPAHVKFHKTLQHAKERGVIGDELVSDLQKLMNLRNPLSHYRPISHPENLSSRALEDRTSAQLILFQDATFAIDIAVKLLAQRAFRLGE